MGRAFVRVLLYYSAFITLYNMQSCGRISYSPYVVTVVFVERPLEPRSRCMHLHRHAV